MTSAEAGEQPSLVHQALLYDSAQQFLATALPFIRDGLTHGHPVLAVTTDANSALLHERLGSAADRVEFVRPTAWYDAPGRTLAACHRYMHERLDGHACVRVIGEPVWTGRDELETLEWKRFEAMVNVAFARAAAWMICTYDSRVLPAELVADARRTHPELAGAGESNTSYLDPVRFSQEYDHELPPPPDKHEALTFDSDPAPVRQFVAAHATMLGLAPQRVDDLVLAANEVVTNAIRHGAGHGRARMWRNGRRVLCEVSDPGYARQDLLGVVPPDPAADHGHGLWIARQLCDLIEIRSLRPGTTVRMHMRV
jgi:anti-sigma regulatory factor (Ser/Thr protein kinase)